MAYVATKDARVFTTAGSVTIRGGITRVADDHELVKDHPDLFRPADEALHFGQAQTARQEPRSPRTRRGDSKDD